jgi:hypothetical protein
VVGWSSTGVAVGYGMQRGSIVSSAADAIRPPTVTNQGGCMLSIAFFLLVGVVAVGIATPWRLGYVVLLGLPGLFGLGLLIGATSMRRGVARRRRRLPDALALWQRAWFCHRCHGVFFSEDTSEVPVRHLLSTGEFRALLWHRVSARC